MATLMKPRADFTISRFFEARKTVMVATSSEMVEVEMDSGGQHPSGPSAARAANMARAVGFQRVRRLGGIGDEGSQAVRSGKETYP